MKPEGSRDGNVSPTFQLAIGCRNRDREAAPTRMGDVAGWGLYRMALVLESSVGEWYTTEFKVDLNQGVVR